MFIAEYRNIRKSGEKIASLMVKTKSETFPFVNSIKQSHWEKQQTRTFHQTVKGSGLNALEQVKKLSWITDVSAEHCFHRLKKNNSKSKNAAFVFFCVDYLNVFCSLISKTEGILFPVFRQTGSSLKSVRSWFSLQSPSQSPYRLMCVQFYLPALKILSWNAVDKQ